MFYKLLAALAYTGPLLVLQRKVPKNSYYVALRERLSATEGGLVIEWEMLTCPEPQVLGRRWGTLLQHDRLIATLRCNTKGPG